MKDKFSAYIEKLQPLLEKIKPWLKTKKAWVQIGLCVVAIVCLIMAGVSSCGRQSVIYESIVPTETVTAEATFEATEEPVVTTTPEITLAPSSTPEATSSTSSSNTVTEDDGPMAPERDITNKVETGPTGAPLYTEVPAENVDTRNEAYRTLVQSAGGSAAYSKYYLFDMDSDGTEELIIHHGESETEAYIDIYTFTDAGLMFVGDSTGNFANISGCSTGGIIVYYRREINGQKYESIENLQKNGDGIYVNTIVPQANVSEYTVLESDVAITAYQLTDLSPLN